MTISLNGNDWVLTGWIKYQWKFDKPMETSGLSQPFVKPVKATVPGSVQTDLKRAGIVADWNEDLNFLNLEWIEHREWVYEKQFVLSENNRSQKYLLDFEGLDFTGYVFLNGKQILYFDQMHIPYEVDISENLLFDKENVLRVVFLQPPEVDGQLGYTSKTTVLKSRFNYGWDWMPRMVNIGIFGDVYIRCVDTACFCDVYPKTEVAGTNGTIDIATEMAGYQDGWVTLQYAVRENGKVCASSKQTVRVAEADKQTVHTTIELKNVQLWYVNGRGGQTLYTVEVTAADEKGKILDRREKQVGFRRLEYARPEGALEDSLPYSFYLNGDWLPVKGLNWVPISPFYGSVTKKEYQYYLEQLRQMNINLLRVWGGSLQESDIFYQLCDEMGFLVWQEFPQSSSGIDNAPCEDPAFVRALAETARSYVIRRRHHACVAVWCAGNELYDEHFTPMTAQNPNVAALEQVVKQWDGDRLFLPDSPSGKAAGWHPEMEGKGYHGDTHGPWQYLGIPKHYEHFNHDDSLLHSEVGAPACPREETLRTYCTGSLWPPSADNPFWLNRGSWWLYDKEMDELFGNFDGSVKGITEYVKAFRYIQMEALRYAATAIRRFGKKKSGLIVWMGNEPFPNSANTSILEYDGCPKPAFYKLKAAFADVMLGLSYDSPAIKGTRKLEVTLFGGSDRPVPVCNIRVAVYDLFGKLLDSIDIGSALIDCAKELAVLSLSVAAPLVIVRITADAGFDLCEEYVFTVDEATPFGALLEMPKTPIVIYPVADNRYRLINASVTAALFVDCIGISDEGLPQVVNNNYRCLLPNEAVEVYTKRPCAKFSAEALNSSSKVAVSSKQEMPFSCELVGTSR